MRKLVGGMELRDEIYVMGKRCQQATVGEWMGVGPVQPLASSPNPWRKMIVAGEVVDGSGAGMMMGGALDMATGKAQMSLQKSCWTYSLGSEWSRRG